MLSVNRSAKRRSEFDRSIGAPTLTDAFDGKKLTIERLASTTILIGSQRGRRYLIGGAQCFDGGHGNESLVCLDFGSPAKIQIPNSTSRYDLVILRTLAVHSTFYIHSVIYIVISTDTGSAYHLLYSFSLHISYLLQNHKCY